MQCPICDEKLILFENDIYVPYSIQRGAFICPTKTNNIIHYVINSGCYSSAWFNGDYLVIRYIGVCKTWVIPYNGGSFYDQNASFVTSYEIPFTKDLLGKIAMLKVFE